MIFHHILSDLVSDFGKGLKGGLIFLGIIFSQGLGLIGSAKILFKNKKWDGDTLT